MEHAAYAGASWVVAEQIASRGSPHCSFVFVDLLP
jgi:hypothetical protein